jgi:CubicO group peptidase (beta-lactamase class C family)
MRKDKRNPPWAIHTQLTHDGFSKKWNQYKNKGYRPIDLESYRIKNTQYYAGIWIKDSIKSWASYRNLTSDQFNQKYRENKSKGRFPIDVDGYVVKGKLLFSGIFVKNTDNIGWSIRRNIKQKDFSAHFKDMSNKGYRLYDTNAYKYKSNVYFAAIWVKPRGSMKWAARRDMNSDAFHSYWSKYRDAGYRIEDIEVYSGKGGTRYAGVWVENDQTRTRWKHKNTVNQLVEDYLDDNPAKGFSLVIYQDGRYRFMKGWGHASTNNNVHAHSRTLYRLASVSKAITGTLGHILQRKNILELNEPIRDFISALDSKHNYDLRQLLSIRSGVCHYDSNCKSYDGTKVKLDDKNSMWKAVKKFHKKDLSASTGDLYYSTHGYTIAANAFERETNRSFNQLLDTYINQPLGIDIVCEDRNRKRSERSQVFNTNLKKSSSPGNIKWKCAGGGMEASVYDVARFGVALEKNRLLSASQKLDMITPPDSQTRGQKRYADGWAIFPRTKDAAVTWYAKAGDQTGGRNYLRVYPDSDLVIALGANTRGSNYDQLVTDIVDAITK